MKKTARLLSVMTLALAGCDSKVQDPKIIDALQETINLERSSDLSDFRVSDTYLANATALNVQIVYNGKSDGLNYNISSDDTLRVTKYNIKESKKAKYFFFAEPVAEIVERPKVSTGKLKYRLFLRYNDIIAPIPYYPAYGNDVINYCLKGDYTKSIQYVPIPKIVNVCMHAEERVKGSYSYY
jgi:hypothetical protein